MIALELDGSDEWKSEIDWQEICLKSLNAAIAQTHFGDLATKKLAIDLGRPWQERLSEARRERRFRFGHAPFGTGDL